jgi:Ca2+-transporting ATPase
MNTSFIEGAHAAHRSDVVANLGTNVERGLSSQDVAARRRRFGTNVLPHVRKRRLAQIIAEQLLNIIVLLLAAAAIIAWLTRDRLEAAAILVVLVLNALIGFITEFEAGRALDALRKQTQISARVRRDGHDQTIAAEELVAGDVVMLSAGDRVPADLRLLEASALHAEEAPLTGESKSVFKTTDVVALDAVIAERSSMLFLGTVVTSGRALAIVVATGEHTELGRIGKLVIDVPEEQTPLQKKLDALGRRLAVIVIVIGAIVAVAGWLRGDGLWTTIEVGISLAVAAVPEALPAVTTFILAFGVLEMARRSAIVRRLTSVETLGSATVICSDKTGTLTLNRMTVTRVEPQSPRALEIAALCSDATRSSGDPTEVALVTCADEQGIDVVALRARYPRVAEVPFDEGAKRMITIHRDGGQFLFALKGAPSVVLDACDIGAAKRASVAAINETLASEGLRVLAMAEKRSQSSDADRDGGYTFLALAGMLDPPRPGVEDAIATARRAGIRVVMLTGDQRHTAEAIARRLGLDASDVYARVSPEEKFRIVESLQSSGEIVAVTGDGVNDAPALKRADVGIAMGERGTEVAKEAADIVLADDNFATIVRAIESGRAIYANIRKFVHMMFSHNLGEVLAVFVAIIVSKGLPLLPLQILWINLVTDVFPAFALALEPPDRDVMSRPPRNPEESMLSKDFLLLIAWQGVMLASIVLAMYFFAVHHYGEGAHARTVALFAMVGVEVGHTLNCRSRIRSAFEGLLRNRHVWFALGTVVMLQIIAVASSPLRRVLDLVSPERLDIALFVAAIVTPVVIVEIQKSVLRRSL